MSGYLHNSVLYVDLAHGELRVSIGKSILAIAATAIPNTGWDEGALKITDKEAFAKAVLHELRREEEDGTTLVHRMLDKAMLRAIEQGCEGVELKGHDA